jgi:hypothetical protein
MNLKYKKNYVALRHLPALLFELAEKPRLHKYYRENKANIRLNVSDRSIVTIYLADFMAFMAQFDQDTIKELANDIKGGFTLLDSLKEVHPMDRPESKAQFMHNIQQPILYAVYLNTSSIAYKMFKKKVAASRIDVQEEYDKLVEKESE